MKTTEASVQTEAVPFLDLKKQYASIRDEIEPAALELLRSQRMILGPEVEALEREMRARLAPVANVPYVVFHDAFQYLEKAFGLPALGSVTVSPERPPGARRIAEIRAAIRKLGARCLFRAPEEPVRREEQQDQRAEEQAADEHDRLALCPGRHHLPPFRAAISASTIFRYFSGSFRKVSSQPLQQKPMRRPL